MADAVSPADGGTTELAEADERALRKRAARAGEGEVSMPGRVAVALLAEYDRRGAELERQRAAVLAIADGLDANLPGFFRSETANRWREALGEKP